MTANLIELQPISEEQPSPEKERYKVNLYIFGAWTSGDCFKEEWISSPLHGAVCKFADVKIIIEEVPNQRLIDSIIQNKTGSTSIVAILYDHSNEESTESAWTISFLLTSDEQSTHQVSFLIDICTSLHETNHVSTIQWPESLTIMSSHIDLPEERTKLFKLIILQPMIDSMSDENIEKVIGTSCKNGSIDVVKLFLSTGRAPPITVWLKHVLEPLDKMSCNDRNVPQFLEIIELAYNLNSAQCIDYLNTRWETTPRAALFSLCKVFHPFNKNLEHLRYTRQSMTVLPSLAISDTCYTHVCLAYNHLKVLPEEIFQLRSLQVLDVSHNCIEKLPSFLRWNCPKLKELCLSHNNLTDERRGIIRQGTTAGGTTVAERRHSYASPEGTGDRHTLPQQKVLQITGQNMYSCVFSLIDVDLSHNPRLGKVPEWVSVLPHVIRLNLSGLPKLRELPRSLVNFKDLTIIHVDPTNMVSPPATICRQGSQSIITYLKSQQRGSSTYRHMNLLMLGWGGEEKSTLTKKLAPQRPTSSVLSSEVFSYDYRGETLDRSVIKVSYHITIFTDAAMELSLYQCFLVQRCVYLCFWNSKEGKKGLQRHLPVLHSIHSTLPHSIVVLVVLCNEGCVQVTSSEILSWQCEIFGVDNPSSLYNQDYASAYGLPCIGHTLIINVNCKEDIERLKQAIHYSAGELKVSNSSEKLVEEMVPRSYTALQSHVESKVKLRTLVLRYSELVDSFRTISHQTGDVADSDKEFGLACQFLHDSGTIFHYKSSPTSSTGSDDLFVLNLQWLSEILAKVINMAQKSSNVIISHSNLISLMSGIGLLSNYHLAFINMMVNLNLLLPLNIDRQSYFFPSLLSENSSHVPFYDLYQDDLIIRKVTFRYLPSSFFSHLTSRLLTYVERLGAQLMILSDPTFVEETTEDPILTGKVSTIKRGKFYKLGRSGYLVREKESENQEENNDAVKKVRALSVSVPHHEAHRDSLSSKMEALSENFRDRLPTFSEPPQDSSSLNWMTSSTYSRSLLWRGGLHVEFLDQTKVWVEFWNNEINFVATGSETSRIKALASLLSSCQIICRERYFKLEYSSHSPCPVCLKDGRGDPPYFDLSLISLADPLTCTKCSSSLTIDRIAPDLLLMDFPQKLRLDKKKLIFEKNDKNCIGKEVFKATYDGQPIVLKLFNSISPNKVPPNSTSKDTISNSDYICNLKNLRFELSILNSISHKNIIQVYGTFRQPLSIAFPLAPLGSLQEHLEMCPNGLEDSLCHITLHQIAQGLKYLHSLHIIHRDIKPSNILVWSLDPKGGVHVKITDCGLSQFADNFGFQLLRGSEDYMAPELYVSSKSRSYDEKVDIFSFGILLYNVVTGKRFIPQFTHRGGAKGGEREREKHLQVPFLSLIANAIEEQRLQGSGRFAVHGSLVNGTHPAARQGHISTCITTCMQVLLESCLTLEPKRRPTAEGIAARLMICVGPSTQERYILDHNWSIENAKLLSQEGWVVGWEPEGKRRLVLIDERTYSTQIVTLPEAEICRHVTMTGDELFVTTSTKRILSYRLPYLKVCVSPTNLLPGLSTCLFTSFYASNVVVGLENGRVLLYTAQDGQPALTTPPIIAKPFDHPDKKKTHVSCGIVHHERILCGSGRYLVGLSVPELQQVFYKPLSKNGTFLKGMVSYGSYLWVWFGDYGEIVICDINSGNRLDSIEMKSLLRDTVNESITSQVLVSTIKASTDVMWVGTTDGHLFGFHHETFELLTAVHQHSYINAIVNTTHSVILVFGQWECGGDSVTETTTIGGFTAWKLYLDNTVT